eukprot:scaffold20316_cov66-Phaeocystis_antarctica.AAC.5
MAGAPAAGRMAATASAFGAAKGAFGAGQASDEITACGQLAALGAVREAARLGAAGPIRPEVGRVRRVHRELPIPPARHGVQPVAERRVVRRVERVGAKLPGRQEADEGLVRQPAEAHHARLLL